MKNQKQKQKNYIYWN